ncbi:DEAD/DEAH box helicase family protein [Actinocorallia sp. B10E7]|uniref:DEAD/DEAH box helicase family protein n=1 Tax=Actinocorallia sp. B10E7 TaxID=3153558 RepID=UPI00325F24C5
MNTSPPGLRFCGVKGHYRSDREDVVANFYLPVFDVATRYDRAVGYFTSTSLALLARGLENFTERGGTMRLVASPHLTEEDITDIERGYDLRAVVERATLREFDSDQPDSILDGLGLLGRLIAEGTLDIKLAFVEQHGKIGIYHEKIGIFYDAASDIIAFTGSSNETYGGLIANFESVEVYCGWVQGDGARAVRLKDDFQALWDNQTPHLRIEHFPSVARERMVQLGKERPGCHLPGTDDALAFLPQPALGLARLSLPAGMTVRPYQRQAVEAWLGQQGRGILKMATGTGKTKTALIAATQLANVQRQREEPLLVVVVAPLIHLVDQWVTEVEAFGVRPVAVYESSSKWQPVVEDQLHEARMGQRPVVVLVVTNDSFTGARFQSVLSRNTLPMLIIADEAHHLGSSSRRAALPASAIYRLALSATPERWFDDEGTDALIGYFGPIAFELGLAQAIEMGALCRYHYRPRLVELTDRETALYLELTGQIAKRMAAGDRLDDTDPNSPIGFLLRQRAGVLGHAEGKLAQLRMDLGERSSSWFQLIYCAEGNRPSEVGEPPGPNQLKDAMNIVGNQLHLSAYPYVADTPRRRRQELLRRFATGDDLRVLVAMRCLDEGVDIPDARVAYLLASSSNPRQFIQRRGRILRRAEGKDHAEILDYLAVPPAQAPINFDVERALLVREFARAHEFGKLSDNYETTLSTLRPLKERYQLMDI